jgi:hypothetical protein
LRLQTARIGSVQLTVRPDAEHVPEGGDARIGIEQTGGPSTKHAVPGVRAALTGLSLSGTLFDSLTKRAASRREHMAVPFFVGTPSTKRTL